jgi:molybdenum cofactor guanylyltransferase
LQTDDFWQYALFAAFAYVEPPPTGSRCPCARHASGGSQKWRQQDHNPHLRPCRRRYGACRINARRLVLAPACPESFPGPADQDGDAYDEGVVISAGVVLAGGRSSRMGTPKAALEWHGSTLLRRTAGILARVTNGPVVVVRAPGQDLPDLPKGTLITDDPRDDKGPVQGIAAGLAALRGRADVAFISSTDMPFLHPAFAGRVLRVLENSETTDVALPLARGFRQPLAAAYRVSLAETAERLVAEDQLRPAFLFGQCTVETLDDAALKQDPLLAELDPDLDSVVNVNTPADYQAARARPAPEVTVQLFGTLAKDSRQSGPHTVRAATVGVAASTLGLLLDRHVTAALNGDQITRDSETPLAAGDTVFFLFADAGG